VTAAKKKKKSSSSKTTTSNDGKEKEELDDSSTAEALPRIEGDPTVDVSSEDVIGEDKRADDAFEEGGAADSLEEEEVVAVSEIPRPKKKKGTKKSQMVSSSSFNIASADPTLLGAGVGAIGLIAYFLWTKMQKRRAKSSPEGEDEEVFDMGGSGGSGSGGRGKEIGAAQTATGGIDKASDSDFYASLNKAAKSGGVEGTGENAPVGASNLPPGLRMFTTMDGEEGEDGGGASTSTSSEKTKEKEKVKPKQPQRVQPMSREFISIQIPL